MKHHCRPSEPQSFTGTVIQSVFDHFNFLVSNACNLELLGHILPQQAIEVFVGARLPAGRVARAAQRLINFGMPAKLFAVVVGQRLDPGFKWCGCIDDHSFAPSQQFCLKPLQ